MKTPLLLGPLLVCLTGPVSAQLRWRPLPDLASQSPSLSYDPVRERIVMFGGGGVYTQFEDTWEWNGSRWEFRDPPVRPSPRPGKKMAFDPVGQRTLLFGGVTGINPKIAFSGTIVNETWVWDGRTWAQLRPKNAPSPRWAAAMASDPIRKRLVLFGGALTLGIFPVPSGETWEWDGSNWIQRFPKTQPGARFGAAMAFNLKTRRVAMFGGHAGLNPLPTGTWEWDGNDWIRIAAKNEPSPRSGAMARHPTRGTVLFHGGGLYGGQRGGTIVDETWELDGTQWRLLVPETFLGPKRGVNIVTDLARKQTLSYGAYSGNVSWTATTWRFTGIDWRPVHEWPTAGGFSIAYDAGRDQLLVTGYPQGVGQYQQAPMSTFVLQDDGSLRQLRPPASPPARTGPSLVYHAGLGKILLHGGYDPRIGNLDDTWVWDGQTWTKDNSPVHPRGLASAQAVCYDRQRKKVVYTAKQETWEWDAQGWVSKGPSPVVVGSLAYDPLRKRTVLFGSANSKYSTWEWDGKSWRDLQPSQTPPGRLATMVYVPGLGGIVLFGGADSSNGVPFTDTWLWDGKSWKQLLKSGPPTHSGIGPAAYDIAQARVIALGPSSFPHRAWELAVETLRSTQLYPHPGEAFSLQASLPGDAGNPFVLALSQHTRPGIPLRQIPGVGIEQLPLTPDALFWLSLQANLNTVLDNKGAGTIPLRIPNDPALLWFSFHAAGFTVRAGGVGAITNPVLLQVVR